MKVEPDLETLLKICEDLVSDFLKHAGSQSDAKYREYYKGMSRGYEGAARLLREELEMVERVNSKVAPEGLRVVK